ncbi:GNAT family N-acetyltransferase [Rhodobacter ferrooxidans]|uniref:Cellulose biosynthesis (CelD)-like protein n=1 Tax=Rhodobacter ferrooxidans TaxID=371731 RepID=C8S496_9RHOB|nr:GNAT family N-acetyltransferase [Rhodobacter sp. SW2]EEW24155.1 cellulose biosynthesis (CelD)-like protein [Rhodobacter sp. SW2]
MTLAQSQTSGTAELVARLEPQFPAAGVWADLLPRRPGATVFAGPLVQAAHVKAFAPSTPVRSLVLRQGGALASIWPLWQRRLAIGGLTVRELGFARDAHSLRNNLLLPGDAAGQSLACLLRACRDLRGWDTLAFDNLPEMAVPLLPEAAAACGIPCDPPRPGRLLLWADMTDGQEAYLASRSGQFRRQLRKRQREFALLGRSAIRVLHGDEITAALPEWKALAARSWQGENPEAAGLTALDWAFHQALVQNGRLWLLELDARPVACLRMLEDHDTAYVHTMHFDPALADHAPGVVLFAAMMEDAAQRGLRRVDFNGNTPFFARWATGATAHQNWRLYRPGLAGQAIRLARAGVARLRQGAAGKAE